MQDKFAAWLHCTTLKRGDLESNRFVARFARRQELWRFTRRLVQRAAALSVFVWHLCIVCERHTWLAAPARTAE
jgi:hypothetical protein